MSPTPFCAPRWRAPSVPKQDHGGSKWKRFFDQSNKKLYIWKIFQTDKYSINRLAICPLQLMGCVT